MNIIYYFLSQTNNIVITNITLKNSVRKQWNSFRFFFDFFIQPRFHLRPENCDHVLIKGITIWAPFTKKSNNLDGIDPGGSRNVLISDCHIDSGDDNVAIKPWSHDIVVENCYFGTGHGASIGSVHNGDV